MQLSDAFLLRREEFTAGNRIIFLLMVHFAPGNTYFFYLDFCSGAINFIALIHGLKAVAIIIFQPLIRIIS